ncbi:MAG: hypothetical protein ACE5HX_13155 [bacterium]
MLFGQNFANIPMFLADMQTRNGRDTANVRRQNKGIGAVEVQIDEEQSKDSETDHATEVVGYIVLSR